MKLFISWSGERSMLVAAALREWLEMMLQAVDPWMSKVDLKAGGRWNPELEKELSQAAFGVTCVTRSNRNAPWLLFEAGALTTQVKTKAFLCPYLIDLETSDLDYPLAQFQAKKWDRDGTLDLVRGINSAVAEAEPNSALDDTALVKLFEVLWPQLEGKFRSVPEEDNSSKIEARDPGEVMLETLEQIREIARRLDFVEQTLGRVDARAAAASFLEPFQGSYTGMIGGPGMTVIPGLGLPSRPIFSVTGKGASPPPNPVDQEFLKLIRDEITKRVEEDQKLRCPKCGETEKFRTEIKEFSERGSHHDIICQNCDTVARQLHRIKGDERDWSCSKKCRFHLSDEVPPH